MITITARIKVKQGTEVKAREILASLLNPSRADAGCISYDLHVCADDPSLFMFYEKWESKAHLDKHIETTHVKEALGKLELEEPTQIEAWTLERELERV